MSRSTETTEADRRRRHPHHRRLRGRSGETGRALVGERLAACVQLTPIRSRYTWKGAVQRDDEILLLIKTGQDLFEAVRARVRALHSYETPEIVMLPVQAGDPDYLAWIAAETQS